MDMTVRNVFLLLALLCATSSPLQAAQRLLWPEGGLSAAQRVETERLHAEARAALSADRAEAALAVLQGASSLLLRDFVAHRLLLDVAAGPPTPASRQLLDWARGEPVRVWRQHEETAAESLLPMFDLAADARDVEFAWQSADERASWRVVLRGDPRALGAALATASPASRRHAAEALLTLPEADFEPLRKQMLASPPGAFPVELWLALSERAPERRALATVLAEGDGGQRLQAIALAERLSGTDAEALLAPLESDPELASAATLALVPVLLRQPAGEAAVLARLGDPRRRAAAAAALLRMPVAQRVRVYETLWRSAGKADRRAGLDYALRLDASSEARALASRWFAGEEVQP